MSKVTFGFCAPVVGTGVAVLVGALLVGDGEGIRDSVGVIVIVGLIDGVMLGETDGSTVGVTVGSVSSGGVGVWVWVGTRSPVGVGVALPTPTTCTVAVTEVAGKSIYEAIPCSTVPESLESCVIRVTIASPS